MCDINSGYGIKCILFVLFSHLILGERIREDVVCRRHCL